MSLARLASVLLFDHFIKFMDDYNEALQKDGFCIVQAPSIHAHLNNLLDEFEYHFMSRFGSDPISNRNLIKRFCDSVFVDQLFIHPDLIYLLKSFGLAYPLFCGPAVSHYTDNDLTGNSYGLPWHQDFPSMSSSSNALIVWTSLTPCSSDTHGLEVAVGHHSSGLLSGSQTDSGYILSKQFFSNTLVLNTNPGDLVVFSPFLPHRTFVNLNSATYKLSLSRRYDDLTCPNWPNHQYANAYRTSVDRELFRCHIN